MIIKICGLKDRQVLQAAIKAGADMAGFMHFAPSPRHLDLAAIGDLIAVADKGIETCVVLVDPDDDLVRAVGRFSPDWIQLHGQEPPQRVTEIGPMTNAKIMKVIGVADHADLASLAAYHGVADRLLLDTKPPTDAKHPGGLGQVFDWSVLDHIDRDIQFMLAGGLNRKNVTEAVRRVRPFGVDVSSGVEVSPGVKSKSAIIEFVAAARGAQKGGAS